MTEEQVSIDKAITEILNSNGALSQPKIQKILSLPPYKNKIRTKKEGKISALSKMGLWKILDKMEQKGEIEKIVLDGKIGFQITPKSKILAELQGHYFQAHLKQNMLDNNVKLLEEFQEQKNNLDPFLKFFGFYVVGSLLVSHGLNEKHMTTHDKKLSVKELEELRQEWLKPVLNLQNGNPISEFFDEIFDSKRGDLEKTITELKKSYKKNMALLELCYQHSNLNNPKMKKLSEDSFDKSAIENMELLRK